MDTYDSNSCSGIERLYYRPIEAALRWCNLVDHEAQILEKVGTALVPDLGIFPQWPCLRLNTEKIWMAIHDGELPYGRDGKLVGEDDRVAPPRVTVRHTDLRAWMKQAYPDQKPKFLFDELERSTHHAITSDSFRALQADRDALKARIEKAEEWAKAIKVERSELKTELESMRALISRQEAPSRRGETTYLNIIGALLEFVLSPRPGRNNTSAIIRELLLNYGDKPGISKATLENKLAAASRSLKESDRLP